MHQLSLDVNLTHITHKLLNPTQTLTPESGLQAGGAAAVAVAVDASLALATKFLMLRTAQDMQVKDIKLDEPCLWHSALWHCCLLVCIGLGCRLDLGLELVALLTCLAKDALTEMSPAPLA